MSRTAEKVKYLLCCALILAVSLSLQSCVSRMQRAKSGGAMADIVAMDKAEMSESSYSDESISNYAGEARAGNQKRKIITSGSLTLEVESLDAAVGEISKILDKFNGYVSNTSIQKNEYGGKYGTITIRAPSAGFHAVFSELKKLGDVKSENVNAEDVTEEYVDTEARLNNLKKEEIRFLEIMDRAVSIKDVLEVEKEIGRVREEIERLTARINYLNNMTDLATISLDLQEEYTVAEVAEKWAPVKTLKNAVRSLLATVKSTVSLLIWLGVYSPLIILLWLMTLILIRIRRRRKSGSV